MQAETNQAVSLFFAAQLSLLHPDKKYGIAVLWLCNRCGYAAHVFVDGW